MKIRERIILVIYFLTIFSVLAQDTIVKKNGEKIGCIITHEDKEYIEYKIRGEKVNISLPNVYRFEKYKTRKSEIIAFKKSKKHNTMDSVSITNIVLVYNKYYFVNGDSAVGYVSYSDDNFLFIKLLNSNITRKTPHTFIKRTQDNIYTTYGSDTLKYKNINQDRRIFKIKDFDNIPVYEMQVFSIGFAASPVTLISQPVFEVGTRYSTQKVGTIKSGFAFGFDITGYVSRNFGLGGSFIFMDLKNEEEKEISQYNNNRYKIIQSSQVSTYNFYINPRGCFGASRNFFVEGYLGLNIQNSVTSISAQSNVINAEGDKIAITAGGILGLGLNWAVHKNFVFYTSPKLIANEFSTFNMDFGLKIMVEKK